MKFQLEEGCLLAVGYLIEGGASQVSTAKTIERTGNAHEGTLLSHGDRNHRNEEEIIILY